MSRRFEFVAGNSSKFWEIEQTGTQVNVRYGRIGSDGQQLCKDLGDRIAASQYADKLVAQKLAKGYAECAAVA